MASKKFADVHMPAELPAKELADHEIFLSFRNDSDAYAFHEWWNDKGSIDFQKYVDEHKDE